MIWRIAYPIDATEAPRIVKAATPSPDPDARIKFIEWPPDTLVEGATVLVTWTVEGPTEEPMPSIWADAIWDEATRRFVETGE